MRIDTLEDLYLEQLKDIYNANNLSLDVTQDLARAATDHELTKALGDEARGLEYGISAIEALAKRHDERLGHEVCAGMAGLAREARAHAIEQSFGEDATKDAMIITQYQRLIHYAIAGYGCLAAFADRLELDEDLVALTACLDASYEGDRIMTELATTGINADARA